MKQSRQILSAGALVLCLLAVLALPCSAMARPVLVWVSSMPELLARYHSEDAPDKMREYASRNPLVCTGDITLGSTAAWVDLVALQGIRIPNGAVLTLDNPNLVIEGPPPVITVEPGGTLRILCWNGVMADGTMPTDGMIRVEAGGTLLVAAGVTLPAGMVVEDALPDNSLPPNTSPPPNQEPGLRPIEAIVDGQLYRACKAGRSHAELVLPTKVLVRLAQKEEGDPDATCRELAVRWDLSEIDCDRPGTYTVWGEFVSEELAAGGISNPKGLRPELSLTILESTPIQDLSWQVIGPSGGNTYALRLSFTPLPEDATHLYLLRSTDGVNWHRDVWPDSLEQSRGENYLPAVNTHQGTSFLACRVPREAQVLYLRLEVEGSICQGSSNIIRIQPATFGEALESGGPKGDEEDGRFDGNRGGGGQGKADRVEQQQPPIETAQLPGEQDVAAPTESAPDGGGKEMDGFIPPSFADGGTAGFTANHASPWLLPQGGATDSSSNVVKAALPEGTAAQGKASGEAPTEEAAPPLPEPEQTGQTNAGDMLEAPAKQPLGSADRNGMVFVASLTLFGGIAVVQQRGKRRKTE